jgi:hypothetical protein
VFLLVLDIILFTHSLVELTIIVIEIVALLIGFYIYIKAHHKHLIDLLIVNTEVYYIIGTLDNSLEIYLIIIELITFYYLVKRSVSLVKKKI